ncbi:MAG: hypothetical protein ACRDRA_01850 [Pseudonocardiaceae bacterium]
MTALDFELEIGSGAAASYPMVVRAPCGEITTSIRLPSTPVQLDQQFAAARNADKRR